MFLTTGISIAFDSGFLAEVLDVGSLPAHNRGSVQTSHNGTTGGHTYIPTKLEEGEDLVLEMGFDPKTAPPSDSVPETITITFANSAGTTWAFTGFMTNYQPTGPFEDRMIASVTIKVSGDITIA